MTAECNLEWKAQSIWRCLSGLASGNLENLNFGNFLQFGHQILVAVLVTTSVVKTGGGSPPGPPRAIRSLQCPEYF